MNNNFDKDLLKIITHYGVSPQLKYFQSEVWELNEAIFEYENFKDDFTYDEKEYKNHIAEEIADVLVMLFQFKEYYNIDGNVIMDIMKKKIDRQLDRISQE